MQITLQHLGQPIGPFPIEQVLAGLANGTYQPTDLAWYPGAPGWGPLASVPGIGSGTTSAPVAAYQTPRTSSLAIWSLVLGILSFLCAGLTGIPGVICGHLALGRIKRSVERKLAAVWRLPGWRRATLAFSSSASRFWPG